MILNSCRKPGLPEPAFEEKAGGFQITFLKNIFSTDYLIRLGLNKRQIEAVENVKEDGKITNKDYQKLNDVSKKTASRDLSKMVKLAILKGS